MRLARVLTSVAICIPALAQTPEPTPAREAADSTAKPALPPYAVVPAERPWEAAQAEVQSKLPPAEQGSTWPSFTSAEAGLIRLGQGPAVVFHSPGRAALAAEVAALLEKQLRLLAHVTAQPVRVLPVVVVGAEESLPRSFGFWVDIDGATCWVLHTSERSLPLREQGHFWADVGRAWLYHETLHECCHHGVCYELRLMPHRWFCEGLSDYLGALAALCYAPDGDTAHASQWIEPLRNTMSAMETIDILAPESWWAPDGSRAEHETAAYAAAQYSMARLVHEHGDAWIARVFSRLAAQPGPDAAELIRIVEEESGARALEERLRAVPLAETLEYLQQGVRHEE